MTLRKKWVLIMVALVGLFSALEIALSRQINLRGSTIAANVWLRSSYQKSTSIFHQDLRERLELQAARLADAQAVTAAVESGDPARIKAAVEERYKPRDLAELWILADHGGSKVIASSGACPEALPALAAAPPPAPPAPPPSPATPSAVRSAFFMCGDVPTMAIAVPLGDNGALGQLALGYQLKEGYVDALQRWTSTEVTLLGPGGVIATTVADHQKQRLPAAIDPGTASRILASGGFFEGESDANVPGYAGFAGAPAAWDPQGGFYLVGGAIDPAANALPVRLVLAIPKPVMTTGVKYSTLAMIAASVGMLFLFAIIVYWLIGELMRPLDALVEATNVVAKGNLNAEIPVPKPPELAKVANALSTMTKSLNDAQNRLLLSQKMAAVGQLAGGLAHEINNPLGVILGFAQGMEKRVKPEDPLRLPVTSIAREAKRCKQIVQELLMYARTGKFQLELVQVGPVVSSLLAPLESRAAAHGVSIKVQIEPDLPGLMATRTQLERILMNLCNNAIDAMPNGGTLTVRVLRDRSDRVRFEVEDTGTGIPEEMRARIFEPFFTTKEVGKGTGLGLSLVYSLVQQYCATIDVRSEVGRGTTMVVKWPVPPQQQMIRAQDGERISYLPRSSSLPPSP